MSIALENKNQTDIINDNNLPLGQKLLKAGFNLITDQEMRERFSCDAITKSEDEKRRKEAESYCVNKNYRVETQDDNYAVFKSYFKNIWYFSIPLMVAVCVPPILLGIFIREEMILFLFFSVLAVGIIGGSSQCIVEGSIKRTIQRVTCFVQTEPLETYAKDIIPDRCLEHINLAKRLGCVDKNLFVAYPVLGRMPKDDPIVFYQLNDDMIEITQWE